MKRMITILLPLFALFTAFSISEQESIGGIWDMGQDNTKIEIEADNDVYTGRIVSSDNPKAIIGKLILKDVKFVGGEWKGKLYSPRKENWFDAVLKVKGNQLSVTVKSGWTSKTVEWTRK